MNLTQLDGMRARSAGLPHHSNPYPTGSASHTDWHWGWDVMDQQIGHVLGNAERMMEGLAQVRMRMEHPPRPARVARTSQLVGVAG